VVTGFLGAGKTTLIRRFLKSPEGQGTAVIVNEFGAVGIDDALVRDSAEQIVLLGNVASAASRGTICNWHCVSF
jgi:cobalamin biosynthesis protein CobW